MWRKKLYRGTWYAVRSAKGKDGKTRTKRASLRTKDRDEAGRRLNQYLIDLEGPRETVSDILEAWQADNRALKAQDTVKFAIKFLTPHFGHLKPHQVTRDGCRKYIAVRNKKSSTIRRELGVLRAALRWHNKSTLAVVEMPPAPPPKERYLTRKEYERLLEAAVSPHIRLFIILALTTAGRASALLELTWDRVDFQRGRIQLSNGAESNKRRAIVPMTPKARDALQESYRARTSEFVIEYAGGKVARILKAFKRTSAKAGLPGVTPHDLRRTAAVWMAEAGVPMSEISQYLGHTNTSVTERVYARYSPEYLGKAANALG